MSKLATSWFGGHEAMDLKEAIFDCCTENQFSHSSDEIGLELRNATPLHTPIVLGGSGSCLKDIFSATGQTVKPPRVMVTG